MKALTLDEILAKIAKQFDDIDARIRKINASLETRKAELQAELQAKSERDAHDATLPHDFESKP